MVNRLQSHRHLYASWNGSRLARNVFRSASFTIFSNSVGGTVAQCVALMPHSKKVVGSSPAWCNMSGLVPGPFCVEFACSPRVHPGSSHWTPQQQKHAEEQMLIIPVPDHRQDWALGPRAPHCWPPTAPGFPWGRTPGWDKGRRDIPPTFPP